MSIKELEAKAKTLKELQRIQCASLALPMRSWGVWGTCNLYSPATRNRATYHTHKFCPF